MHGSISGQPLQSSAHGDQVTDLLICFKKLLKFRVDLQCPVNGDIQLIGNHFGNRIHISIGKIHYSAHITDDTLCCHGTKGNDLHDFICAIFFPDIINDFLSSFKAEIHIDIRHGYTFRIQETFKQKIIANRIQLCNSKRISYQTACCRSSSRSYHNVMVSCIPDEIPHNKEIIHIPHIFNNTQLIIKTFFQVFCTFRITFL